MIKIKKILFPTDFSEFANHALIYVKEFANLHGAKVILLHVNEMANYANGYGFGPTYYEYDIDIKNYSIQQMNKLKDSLSKEDFEVETQISQGNPFVAIVESSKKHNVDLIIMATHGYGAIKHLLIGSTAEKVVQHSTCPVLTIKHPEHEFVQPG